MFNLSEFQKDITHMLFLGELEKAKAKLWDDPPPDIPNSAQLRVDLLKKLYSQIVEIYNRDYNGFDKIALEEVKEEELSWLTVEKNLKDLLCLEPGNYQFTSASRNRTWFDIDFKKYNERFKRNLRRSRFHVPIETINKTKFRIVNDVRVCCSDPQLYTFVSNGKFWREQSGRLAKACSINYIQEEKEEIDSALLLPIPHIYGNYYHVLSEMFYALRFVQWIPDDTKIIIGPDRFNLLPYFSSQLKINQERFIQIKDCANLKIRKAILPSHPNYFWDSEVFEYFRKFSEAKKGNLKLYISRSLSSRSISNEIELEKELQKRGFIVLHSECLTFPQQIFLFSQAETVISPHGAGEANMLFMHPHTNLIELFSENFVCRDFYLRSRHINIQYDLHIYKDHIDIDDLLQKIK